MYIDREPGSAAIASTLRFEVSSRRRPQHSAWAGPDGSAVAALLQPVSRWAEVYGWLTLKGQRMVNESITAGHCPASWDR